MKKIIISENELAKLINSAVIKKLSENKNIFTSDTDRPISDREIEIKNMFGKYQNHLPADVVRYLRKSPKTILERLYKIYGDNLQTYLDEIKSKLSGENSNITEQYVNDDNLELDDSDISELLDSGGNFRRFRGSIYYDGIVPETDDKEYDRKVAIAIIDNDRKKMKNMETYIGGVGFRQNRLDKPFDNTDF